MARVTMSDVARAAGVSVMTVSNALNGRPNVGAATRDRVLDVVRELGYEINLTARSLRSGRTGTVALVVPWFDHTYFGDLAARLGTRLAAQGRHLVMEQSGASAAGELAALSPARLQAHDAVILSAVGLRARDIDRLHTSVPIVLLGERDMPARFDHVRMDNHGGSRMATAHLLDRGARRVVVLGGTLNTDEEGMSASRTTGWLSAHRERGIDPDERLVVELEQNETADARQRLRTLLGSGVVFDAVFAVTDMVALGALAALADAGLRVPQDVQVAGFDDLGMSEHLTPSLTTIDPGHDVIADTAAGIVDRRLTSAGTGSPPPAPEHVVAAASLVVRGSTR